jgi:cytochrome c peroxidase
MNKHFWISFIAIIFSLGACQRDVPFELDEEFPPHTTTAYQLPERVTGYPVYELKSDNPLTEEGVALGRFLFYDPILSSDSTQSCGSCHFQSNAFSDPRRFSVGVTGAIGKRNSMSLFNLMWQPSFFWDGRSLSIRDQVIDPIEDPTEMNSSMPEALRKLNASRFYREHFHKAFGTSKITKELYSKAMEQFLFTLISFNSDYDKFLRGEPTGFSAEAFRGLQLFNREPAQGGADCFHCHGNIFLADFTFSNNGLNLVHTDLGHGKVTGKSFDEGKFKVVSLRNLELTAPYMHDGRFTTIEEVVRFYNEGVHANSPNIDPKMDLIPLGLNLSQEDQAALVAFLKSLTDTSFVTNPKFSNPFK